MTTPLRPLAVLAAAVLVAATACGGEGDESTGTAEPDTPVDQTVEVTMDDFSFEPKAFTVRAGTTVRFRFRNEGAFVHDAAIGDQAFQKAVAEGKAERDGPAVNPRKSRDYVKTFSQPGELIIGCHQPGHYQQGMRARLTVA